MAVALLMLYVIMQSFAMPGTVGLSLLAGALYGAIQVGARLGAAAAARPGRDAPAMPRAAAAWPGRDAPVMPSKQQGAASQHVQRGTTCIAS